MIAKSDLHGSVNYKPTHALQHMMGIWHGVGPHHMHGAFDHKGLPGVGAFDNLVKYREF